MANKRRKAAGASDRVALWRGLGWVLLAGGWVLLGASLFSYDPADWPGHRVAPHNVDTQNWVGPMGAFVAHKLYLMVGPGVWIAVAGGTVFLIASGIGRGVSQLVLRSIGLLIMSFGASAILALGLPEDAWGWWGPRPEGLGGLVAIFLNQELAVRFGFLGSMIIMAVGFFLGAILTMDQVILALPRVVGDLCYGLTRVRLPRLGLIGGVWHLIGAAAGGVWSAVGLLGRSRGGVARRVKRKPEPVVRGRGRSRVVVEDECDPDEADEAYEYDDDEAIEAELDEEEELEAGVDAPGAYASSQSFDPDQLRAKIKQLPINFAPKAKAATPAVLGGCAEVDLSGYRFPGLDLLEEPEGDFTQEMERVVRDQAVQLESAMQQYRIEGEVVGIDSGPVITLYEVRLAPGTKVSRLSVVSSDLARALKSHNIRIVPNMAGKDTVGIEVPNIKKERVRLKELMTANADTVRKMKLPMFLGKDASGNPQVGDLSAMPHMLIAGTTGSGKSVCINSIIMSFLYTKRPDELKLVLVDPKMVELSMFRDVPHLMCPVVTEMSKATAILEWATTKMDERYELLAEAGVRDIAGYNDLEWEDLVERFDPANEAEEARIPKKLPYLVFIVDELADLMMTNKEVESFIVRIAQKARAVGIHLILATQRPQANVVTGLIKSNMPCRVSFKVASGMDSRIVLDQKGAELLLGQGDMLYLSPRTSKITRSQGTLVDDVEIRRCVKFLKTVSKQSFEPQLMQLKSTGTGLEDEAERDPLFDEAVRVVLESKRGSVSLLQRRLTVGYSRASRLIEQMAEAGIIGEYKGSQAREVNMTVEQWDALRAEAEAEAAAIEPEIEDEIDDEIDDELEEEIEDGYEGGDEEGQEYEDGEEEDDDEELGEYEEEWEEEDEEEQVKV